MLVRLDYNIDAMLKNTFVASLALLIVATIAGSALAQKPANDRPVNWKELPEPFQFRSTTS